MVQIWIFFNNTESMKHINVKRILFVLVLVQFWPFNKNMFTRNNERSRYIGQYRLIITRYTRVGQ